MGACIVKVLEDPFWKFYIYIVDITMQLPFQMIGWGVQDVGVPLKLFGIVPIAILVFVREW